MILLVVIALAVLVGLLTGGKLANLSALNIRRGELAFGALSLQALLIYGPWLDRETTRSAAVGLMLFSYLPLFVFIWLNKDIYGIQLVALGLLLNFAAIAFNGGYMPVSPETLQRMGYDTSNPALSVGSRVPNSKDRILTREETRLWGLSDIFVTPRSLPWTFAYSIGDVIASIGAFILIQKSMQTVGNTEQP